MNVAAIVERRQLHWYVYLPALATGGRVPEPNDVVTTASELAAAATGLSPHEVHIALHLAVPADALLTTPPVDVEVQHTDGVWSTARRIGWARCRDGSWKSLVRYVAQGSTWERTVHASCIREQGEAQPGGTGVAPIAAILRPRAPGPLAVLGRSRSVASRR